MEMKEYERFFRPEKVVLKRYTSNWRHKNDNMAHVKRLVAKSLLQLNNKSGATSAGNLQQVVSSGQTHVKSSMDLVGRMSGLASPSVVGGGTQSLKGGSIRSLADGRL